MTRDLPSDADAGDVGDHAGDAAYRVASGVARVTRAGAYVTGGALIAAGGGTPTTPQSEDESQIAGWSVKDPQPNAPSPVITYPDPSPESAPPGPAHPAPPASGIPGPQDGPPGLYFHVQINPGPGDDHVPGLDQIPGMNGIPGTDGTPGIGAIPNTDDGSGNGHHPPATGDVPGLGNGIPGLGKIPGLGNIPGLGHGIPGLGSNPGTGGSIPGLHIPGLTSGDGGSGLGLPGMHPAAAPIAADGSPGFSPESALSNLIHPAADLGGPSGFGPIDLGDNSAAFGDGPDFAHFGADAAVPQADSGAGLSGFHLPGLEAGGSGLPGPGSGFDGVGSDFGAFADISTQLDAHAGLDGVWLTVDTQVHLGVGDIGQELDNFGSHGGWLGGAQAAPGSVPVMNSGLLGAQPAMGDSGLAGIAAPGAAPAMPGTPGAAPAGPGAVPTAFGGVPTAPGTVPSVSTAPGVPGAAPGSGVVLPGAAATSVPSFVSAPGPSMPAPAVGAPGAAMPSLAPAMSVAAPGSVAALPTISPTPVAAVPPPVVPAPAAPAVAPQAIAIAQPVAATPLQPSVHPDAAPHSLLAALPDHVAGVPLGLTEAVGPAAFLGVPRPAAPNGGPGTSSGEHSTPTSIPETRPGIPHVSIAPVPVSGTVTPGHTVDPSRTPFGPTPIDQSGSPTTGVHVGPGGSTSTDSTTGAHPTTDDSTTHARPGSTGTNDSTTAAHPTTDGSTTHAHPGSTGTDDTTVPHPSSTNAADSTTTLPGRDSTQPTHDSTPTHDSAPTHDTGPTYDGGPTRDSGPTYSSGPSHDTGPTYSDPGHDTAPSFDSPQPPREPFVPSHVPSMPSHEAPPNVTIPRVPGNDGQLPGAHLAPHAPLLPPTFEPGAPLPMKPIAHVMHSNDVAPWDDYSHAGLSVVPVSLLSSGLLPGTELDPSHIPVHPVPDLHVVL